MDSRRPGMGARGAALAAAAVLLGGCALVCPCTTDAVRGRVLLEPLPGGVSTTPRGPFALRVVDDLRSFQAGDAVAIDLGPAGTFGACVGSVDDLADGSVRLVSDDRNLTRIRLVQRSGAAWGEVRRGTDRIVFVPASDGVVTAARRPFVPPASCATRPARPRPRVVATSEDVAAATSAPSGMRAPTPEELEHLPDTVIRIAVVTTPGADLSAGAGREACFRDVEDWTNLYFGGCGSAARVEVVDGGAAGDPPDGGMGRWLDCLRDPNDGFWDEVHALRDEVGADVVCLVVAGGEHHGVAFQMRRDDDPSAFAEDAFLLARDGPFRVTPVLAHELGHILGCGHNPEDPDDLPENRADDCGYAWVDPAGRYCTLMTTSRKGPSGTMESVGEMALSHSSASGECEWGPLGDASHDNASVIARSWRWVANFRRGVPAVTPPPDLDAPSAEE